MRNLLLFFTLVLSLHCVAQNRVFMGRVIDKNKRPVPFAIVEAKDRNEGVYCDENGVFSFTGNANDITTLVVFCMGFERKEIATEILPLDSIIITLSAKPAVLKNVEIVGKKGKPTKEILGKSRKRLNNEGDCYRFYGSETAIRLKADTTHGGMLNTVNVFIASDGDWKTKFRIHIYEWDKLPTHEITDSNLVVQATSGNSWVSVDLSSKQIPIGRGLFVSVEWISGFGNSDVPLQSDKNPEVNKYNGQVLGLTTDYGKPSKTYSRKPFSKEWIYYDAPDAARKGGYFLNPMIYCTYTYWR
jgi:hypothetical protein